LTPGVSTSKLGAGPTAGSKGRRLAAHRGQSRHRQADVAPGDLARAAVEPAGSDADVDGFPCGRWPSRTASSLWRAVVRSWHLSERNGRSIAPETLVEQTFDVKPSARRLIDAAIVPVPLTAAWPGKADARSIWRRPAQPRMRGRRLERLERFLIHTRATSGNLGPPSSPVAPETSPWKPLPSVGQPRKGVWAAITRPAAAGRVLRARIPCPMSVSYEIGNF